MQNFTAIFEQAAEGGYVGWVKEVPEAMSQGKTYEDVRASLLEALKLVLKTPQQPAADIARNLKATHEKMPLQRPELVKVRYFEDFSLA